MNYTYRRRKGGQLIVVNGLQQFATFCLMGSFSNPVCPPVVQNQNEVSTRDFSGLTDYEDIITTEGTPFVATVRREHTF